MRSRPFPFSVPEVLVATLLLGALRVGAQAPAPASIEIVSCIVYSETNKKDSFDCSAKARAQCKAAASCELPIGMALTDGRNIGDPQSWKKVRVQYRCGSFEHVNGPYNQDDHATMHLSCRGGG